jgi:hypothetical protein
MDSETHWRDSTKFSKSWMRENGKSDEIYYIDSLKFLTWILFFFLLHYLHRIVYLTQKLLYIYANFLKI